ncbi:hypothetical protein LTR36_007533 [Oleoguttula mirabilis]|uniref:Uncharacterized protein n=1 Tax=Oleoguttula mirabilis TaxID=1507867 RepID=A0AAV9JVF9_9PEZI|nr:hypothetical protein LTR36_007533 [Oleoguttula mirabilis]
MADIQQWRRMVQPARARTPAVEHAGDDSDGVASPTTPKRGLKPKFSSYFTNPGGAALAVQAERSFTSLNFDLFAPRLPAWPEDEQYPSPNAEALIDSIMCRLMSEPYGSLDQRFNGMLMRIFECYRHVGDERTQLQDQLEDEISRHKALLQRLHHSQKQWSMEREDYRSEIKRLELLLAKGKRGLAEVTLARQDSELRQKNNDRRSKQEDDGLETIFEFLEKTSRSEDKAWSSQRATFRARQPSPSAQMRRLSKQLISKKSMTNIHTDLPFGTPPDAIPSTLAEASKLEGQAANNECKRVATGLRSMFSPKTSFSDETCSTFSCVSDLLPDEVVNVIETAGTEDELVAIKRVANVLARRRDIDPSTTVSKLSELFGSQSVGTSNSGIATVPAACGIQLQMPRSTKSVPASAVAKHPSLMSKASGFFHKLRPQLAIDTSSSPRRRFSLDTGEDVVASSSTLVAQPPVLEKDCMLRKSVSLMSLAEIAAAIEHRL